jgi:hypothetical protein
MSQTTKNDSAVEDAAAAAAAVAAAVPNHVRYDGDLAVWFDEHGHYGLDDYNYADKNDDLFEYDIRTGNWNKIGKFDVKFCIENPQLYH